jgi:ParB family chromosome partitioning protein
MSKHARQAQLKIIPIAAIEVLNPRERNQRIFDDIVGNALPAGLR